MNLSTPKWDCLNESRDGLLFFSQRLDEMLFSYTIDLYRVPVLNTHLLLREYISVYRDRAINDKYLKQIYEELRDSLNSDVVISHYWGRDNIDRTLDAFKSIPGDARISFVEYLLHVTGETKYYEWCRDYAKMIVPQNEQKEKIEGLLRCLIPELIGHGYTPQFIYWYNKKMLLNSTDPSIDTFIDRFDRKPREYKVYIAAEKLIEKFKELISCRLQFSFDDDGNFQKFYKTRGRPKPQKDQVIFYFDGIKALDEQAASRKAFEKISLFLKFYSAVDNKPTPIFHETAMVIDSVNESTSYVSFGLTEYNVIQGMKLDEASDYTEQLISNLVSYARCSIDQLTKIIDLHNNSLRSPDYNGSFLNLWSALEVLSMETVGEDTLSQVSETLLPVLGLNYYQSVFDNLTKQLEGALSTEDYSSLLAKIEEGDTPRQKIATLIIHNKYDDLRAGLSGQLAQYPVIRFRLHTLHHFADNHKSLLSPCTRYIERVRWHLSRIYRTRNAIVHSGNTPSYIRNLGEHLHYYLDVLLFECFNRLCNGTQLCKIEIALFDAYLSFKSLRNRFSDKNEITFDDIAELVEPHHSKQVAFEYTCDCES